MVGEMFDRARRPRSTAFLLAAIAGAGVAWGCARRSEFIGTVIGSDGGAGDALDGADTGDGPGSGTSEGDPSAVLCRPDDPPPLVVVEPTWNCPALSPRCRIDARLDPAITPTLFKAAAVLAGPGPVIVYPLAGSVHPLNLDRLTVQWNRPPGATQKVFRIHVEAIGKPQNSYDFLAPDPTPATIPAPPPQEAMAYQIPPEAWRWIGSVNPGAEMKLTVAGYDASINQVVTSPPITVRFSSVPVQGELVFLATRDSHSLQRQVFGSAGDPQPIVTSPVAGVAGLDCAGCHSLSRDGGRMAFAATYGGHLTVVSTLDGGNPIIAPTLDRSDAVAPALSPDGKWLFARWAIPNGNVDLRDAGGALPAFDSKTSFEMGGRIDFPEWSPRGTEIVAGRATGAVQPSEPYAANDGSIVVIPITVTAGRPAIGTPTELVPASADRSYGYPSFSPDGKWVVFASWPAGQSSHPDDKTNPATRLHLISRAAPTPIHDLAEATRQLDRASTYPRFAPFAQGHCGTFFLTFQSRMDYGVIRVTSRDALPAWPQLWMTSIDLTRLNSPTADPSSPPLWLPFQDIANKNLLATWSAQGM
jgi:hypothetical protein